VHFPAFIELEDRSCLVVGGGRVAAHKAAALASYGARVTVIAPELDPSLASIEGCRCVRRCFADGDIDGQPLVVAATDDAQTNARVSRLCRARGILVNVVDDPANCTFVFPAVCRKGPMTVAVSSGGACPVAAKMVRDRVAGLLPDDFIAAVEELGNARDDLKRRFPSYAERREHCERTLEKWKD